MVGVIVVSHPALREAKRSDSMRQFLLFFLVELLLTSCAVGYGKRSDVRVMPMTDQQYVITVDGDPWLTTTGKMTEQFHDRARTLCPSGYDIISFRDQQGHGGVFSFSLSNVTGTVKCK